MEITSNGINLFLAIEQGAGKFENDMLVVLNLRFKKAVTKQILEEYPNMKITKDYLYKKLILLAIQK